MTQSDAALAIGLTMMGEALVMLLIDHFAEARAQTDQAALGAFRF